MKDRFRWGCAILLPALLFLISGCTLRDSGPVARFEIIPAVIYAEEGVTFDASSSTTGGGGRAIVAYS